MVVEAVIFLFSCKVLANRVNGLDYDSSICSSERLMFGFFFSGRGNELSKSESTELFESTDDAHGSHEKK